MLSNFFQDIHLFRFDPQTQEIYILAGTDDQIEIVIYADGAQF